MKKLVTAVVFVVLTAVGFGVAPAHAHSDLISSTPAEGSRVAALSEFSLTFVEAAVPEMSSYTLTDPSGSKVSLGEATYDVSKTMVTVPVKGQLTSGKYLIGFAILSIDGHPISGTVAFTSTAVAPSPSAHASHAPSVTPTEVATEHDHSDEVESGESTLWANIGYAAIGLVVGVIVVFIINRSMRRRGKATTSRLDDDNPNG